MARVRVQRRCSISALALGIVLLGGACAAAPRYARSAHFDGRRFHNPRRVPPPSFSAIAKHVVFGRNGKWPQERLAARGRFVAKCLRKDPIAITLVNHATLLIQWRGLNLLTDPVWSERVGPWGWAGPPRARAPGIPFSRLPKIDVVVISHNHYDHMDIATLRTLWRRDKPQILVPLGDRDWLLREGIGRRNSDALRELDWWSEVVIAPDLSIVFTPAQHNSGRGLFDRNKSLWGGYLIRSGKRSIFFAGDTAYEGHFRAIRKRFGAVEVALLPIGAYLPRAMMKRYHMNPREAVMAQADLGAPLAIGMHHGTFQLTDEDFRAPVRDLRRAFRARQQHRNGAKARPSKVRFLTPREGDTVLVPAVP